MSGYGKCKIWSAPERGWKKFLVLIMTMYCAGCATEISETTICPELVVYSVAFQVQAADEIKSLPAESATTSLVQDYLQLRDRIRAACPG
jgi:hypothetical protein